MNESDSGTVAERKAAFAPLTVIGAGQGGAAGSGASPGAAATQGPPTRSTLAWRLFLATAAIVALVLVVTLGVTYISAEHAATVTVGEALEATSKHVTGSLARQTHELEATASLDVGSSVFRSTIESRTEAADYFNRAQDAADDIGASWVQLTDTAGQEHTSE